MLEDSVEARSDEGQGDHTRHPGRHVPGARRPTEPEEADGEEDAANRYGWQSRFRDGAPVGLARGTHIVGLIAQVDAQGGEDPHEEG